MTDLQPAPLPKGSLVETRHTDYHLRPAKYAKGKWALTPTPDGTGFKTRAACLAEALAVSWTGREKAYILSELRARRFVTLYAAVFTANVYTKEIFKGTAHE